MYVCIQHNNETHTHTTDHKLVSGHKLCKQLLPELFLGRSAMKHLKPVWVLAESSTGYFLDLQVYVGKEGSGTEHGLGERVVLDLTEKYRGEAHRIFCDNFFSSPRLFMALHAHLLYACGTVRQNRLDFPLDLRGITLKVGNSSFVRAALSLLKSGRINGLSISSRHFPSQVQLSQCHVDREMAHASQ